MQKHIEFLKKTLESQGWDIVEVQDGNDLDISEIWQVKRYNCTKRLAFDGMGDLEVLPIEQSYACFDLSQPKHNVYFSKNGKDWKQPIRLFVSELDCTS